MRIWIVNHYALPPGSRGGPSRHLGLSRALQRRGHEVTIVASAYDHYTRSFHRDLGGSPALVEEIDGVRYVWLATPAYDGTAGRIRNMAAFARAVDRHASAAVPQPPDVILGSSPHLLAPWAASRLARRLGIPFVMEVRDLWPQSIVDLGEMGPRHPAIVGLRRLERSLYGSAEHVVVVPPGASDYVASHGGRAGRITHIPNGVDLTAWPDPAPPPDGDRFTIVYAGTIGHANGLETAVEAANLLASDGVQDISMRLVGAGPERDRLRALATSGGGSVVAIEDPVRAADVPALLASADACLMLLRDSPVFRWGISPTKLFEYFAAGRPVVFSVRTPVDLVAELDGGESAVPGDPRSLADAIVRLRNVPKAERDAMGARLRRHAEAHHSFDALAVEFEAVLDQVVGASLANDR